MLAKLIKHEFKATARIFLPILGTVLVLTGAAALTVKLGGCKYSCRMRISEREG